MTLKEHIMKLQTYKMYEGEDTIYVERDDVLKALEQTRWIPCSERLPEAGEYIGDVAKYYLVQNEYGDMLVAKYTHGGYWEQIYQLKPIGDEIVAWQPLPKEYREENDNA